MAAWSGGDGRDVTIVQVVGTVVQGAANDAVQLRKQYRLPVHRFEVLLVGKDGHIALRSSTPVSGDEFRQLIDARPMRKAGQR